VPPAPGSPPPRPPRPAAAAPAPARAPWRPAVMPAAAASPPRSRRPSCGPSGPGSVPSPGSAIALPGAGRPGGGLAAERGVLFELLRGLGDVALVLEQDVGRAGGDGGVDLLEAEQQKRPGPVEGLGDRRRLLRSEEHTSEL